MHLPARKQLDYDKGRGKPGRGLFLTDFDGTLLGSDGTLASEDIAALETLTRHGVRTAVATGRSLYSFYNSPGADLPIDYIIFSSGAGVISRPHRKLLYHKNMSSGMVFEVLDFLQASTFDFMLHRPVPDNHRYVYRRVSQNNPDFERRIERYRDFGKPLNSISKNGYGEACQFLAVIPQDRTHEALKIARNGLPELSIIRSTSPLDHKSTWIEFFHPEVSKSKTAAWLASELGVDQTDTMAIGNDYNDLDLLTWAGRSFVVKNAPDELKSRFQQVASNDNSGVAEAVNYWLEHRKYNV